MNMNPKVKSKWVEALKSGEYLQGKGALRTMENGEFRHCCLGVLCDLYSKEFGEPWRQDGATSYFLGSRDYLPTKVRHWAGLILTYGGHVRMAEFTASGAEAKPQLSSLPTWNDNGEPFERIAEAIVGQL